MCDLKFTDRKMSLGICDYAVAVLFAVLCSIRSCVSENAPYTSFAKDATLAQPVEYYDYIIIGGGTSGCALAATLSEGTRVLLLERGGLPYGDPHISNISGFAATLADVSPASASQPFISTDGVFNHRARVLGGGTAINAGFYSRASSDYVNSVGWDQRLVNESYEWVERKVVFRPPMLAWQSAVRDGLLEAGVLPDNGFSYDHLKGTKFGGTIFDENGRRHTAADLLEYADPTKIIVYLYASVQKILFQQTEGEFVQVSGLPKPRANGVNYKDSRGNVHTAYLNGDNPLNEVILSAGTIGSPQLLMLSGIGPSEHLTAHQIKVLLDQPMVGQGLSDNPLNLLIVPSPRPVETSLAEVVGITNFGSFVEASSGTFELDWVLRVAKKLRDKIGQDFNVSTPFSKTAAMAEFPIHHDSIIRGGAIGEKIIGPFSNGYLELQSRYPSDNPRVTFNYFKDPRDLERCVKGLEVVLKIIQSKAFSEFVYPLIPLQSYIKLVLALPLNLRPRHLSAIDSLEQFCIDTVMTIWHYHGGCQIDRVVDHDYKVVGVDALRVIDSSTFYDSPGTNPQATVMMLGRYMGQRILQERAPR